MGFPSCVTTSCCDLNVQQRLASVLLERDKMPGLLPKLGQPASELCSARYLQR